MQPNNEARQEPDSAGTDGANGMAVAVVPRPGHDAPIGRRNEDDLDRWPVARAIYRVIGSAPPGWSTRVGLYGRWGTGKTSVLNFLEQLESERGSIVVRFSAWSAVGEGGVVAQFYDELADQLKQRKIDTPFTSTAKRWGRAIAAKGGPFTDLAKSGANALLPGSGVAVGALGGLGGSLLKVSDDDLRSLRKSLGDKRVVVFIDDLDRADPRVIPKTLLAMRELLDWPDFAFVLAFDETVVAGALKEYSKSFGESAQQFLEKIVDFKFELPVPEPRQVRRLAERVLAQCCDFIPEAEREHVAQWFPPNPRQAKLVARSLAILRDVALRHDPGELDWRGIMLQHVLRHTCPPLAAFLEEEMLGIGGAGWGRFLKVGSQEEGDNKLSEAIHQHTNSMQSSAERKWIAELARNVVQSRELSSKAKIEYEMRLSVREPCLTWKEFQSLLDRCLKDSASDVLSKELEAGATRGGGTRVDAAQEIVEAAIEHYDNLLKRGSQATTRQALESDAAEAGRALTLLEQLWSESAPQELRETAASNNATEKLLSVLARWLHFVVNPSDRPLRKREHSLMKRAAAMCPDKISFYFKTGPTWMDEVPATTENERDERYRWLTEIREVVLPEVLDRVLRWFSEPDGVMMVLQGEQYDRKVSWLIESPDSPLYRDDATVLRLTDAFGVAVESADVVARGTAARNARDYLLALLGAARSNGTWMGPDKMRTFVERHPSVVPSAWRLTTAVEAQHRAKKTLRDLRMDLSRVGVELDKLYMPDWLLEQPSSPAVSDEPSDLTTPSPHGTADGETR